MKKILITLICLTVSVIGMAQNLISNGSFEENTCCPSVYSMFYCVQDWIAPTKGTTDYYSDCELKHYSPIVKTPTNFFGHQKTVDGVAYAGLYTFYNGDYREYMQNKLQAPLVAGETYHINFWVSLADTAGVAVRSISIAFLDSIYKKKQFTVITDIDYIPMYNEDSSFLTSKKDWMLLSMDYEAKGGEAFFIIGNYQDNASTDTLNVQDTSTAEYDFYDSYYYLDAVCIGLRKPDGTCSCINDGEPVAINDSNYIDLENIQPTESEANIPKIGDIVILKNVYFDFDKSILKASSEPELQQLYDLLIQFPTMKIIINGHTDNRGSDEYNSLLSESRALSVYAWLVNKGIESSRLDFKGYGKFKPIESNKTDEGRQSNRRVEFEVVEIER